MPISPGFWEWGCPYQRDSSTSETRRELEPTHNCLLDRYWGRDVQLLASFFPVPSNSPRNLCESLLVPGSLFFLKSHEIYREVFQHFLMRLNKYLFNTVNNKKCERSAVSGQSFGSSAVSLAYITSMCSVQCFHSGHSLRLAFRSFFYPHPSPP